MYIRKERLKKNEKSNDHASVYHSIALLNVYISLALIQSYVDGEEQRKVPCSSLNEL